MSDARSPLLANASVSDLGREIVRRMEDWLASLPDGKRWTRMDWVFASIVAVLATTSTGFFTTTYQIMSEDPDYFFHRLVASFDTEGVDPIETGAIGTAAAGGEPADIMPVPQIHREAALQPRDYEIVMVFSDEVLLATSHELMRAKVGSVLPGLGRMLGIDAGNVVRFERATLTPVAD